MSTNRTMSKLWKGVMAQALEPAACAQDGAVEATKNARRVRRGLLFAGVATTGLMVSLEAQHRATAGGRGERGSDAFNGYRYWL
jgi:hypothetical protein